MKKRLSILFSVVLIFAVAQNATYAQELTTKEKQKKEQETQEKLIKEIEHEKLKAEELYKKGMIDASSRRAEIRVLNDEMSSLARESAGWSVPYGDVYLSMGGSQDSESLEYRKTVNGSTFTKELPFDVEEGSRSVSISVSGSCKEGEVRIKILMPGGKTYTEVLLDEYGSVNWKKSFSTEDDNKERTGKWKFVINSKEATGNFSLSIKSH
ncbi:MAG: hypothetical protein QNK33_01995 [Bacteroidales bacterium]|nr:hypothetical protein [Bacteroidales bacterium]